MATNTTVSGMDISALSWVQGEIESSFTRGLEQLASFRQSPSDRSPLQRARAYFRQGVGAIQMVGLDALAAFAVEIEVELERLGDLPEALIPANIECIDAAARKLLIFLSELSNGAPLSPLILFPHYEALQKLRDVKWSNPADLFFPDVSLRVPDDGPQVAITQDQFPDFLIKKRRVYEHGLLDFLRGSASGVERMSKAVSAIVEATPQHTIRTFWFTVSALLDAMGEGKIERSFALQHLLARVDLQIRRLVEGGANVAERLRRETLYFVARDNKPTSDRVKTTQRVFNLASLLPKPEDAQKDVLGMYQVIRDLRTHVNAVKSMWARLIAGQVEQFADLRQELLYLFKQAAKSPYPEMQLLFGVLGKGSEQIDPRNIADTVGMEYATALLFAEDVFAQYGNPVPELAQQINAIRARINAALKGEALPAFDLPRLHEISQQAEDKILLPQLADGIQTNLRRMEQELDLFFRDNTKRENLAALQKDGQEISGALRVLGRDDADALLHFCLEQIASYEASSSSELTGDDFELLADSLSALGFYIESLEQQRLPGTDLIAPLIDRYRERSGLPPEEPPPSKPKKDEKPEKNAEDVELSLSLTNDAPFVGNNLSASASSFVMKPPPFVPDLTAFQDTVVRETESLIESERSVVDVSSADMEGMSPKDNAKGAMSIEDAALLAIESLHHPQPIRRAPETPIEAMEAVELPSAGEDDDFDAIEIPTVELVAEEATDNLLDEDKPLEVAVKESVVELAQWGKLLIVDPDDEDLFARITRKIQLLGDDAKLISNETLLNKIGEIKRAMAGRPRHVVAALLIALADQPVAAPSEEAKRLMTVDAESLDEELLDIFLEEANEVLDSVEENHAALERRPDDIESLRASRRAFHTLKGSGRMVGLKDLGEIAYDVEKIHNQLLETGAPATEKVLIMITVAEQNFRQWIKALIDTKTVTPDPTELRRAIAEVAEEAAPRAASLSEILHAAKTGAKPEAQAVAKASIEKMMTATAPATAARAIGDIADFKEREAQQRATDTASPAKSPLSSRVIPQKSRSVASLSPREEEVSLEVVGRAAKSTEGKSAEISLDIGDDSQEREAFQKPSRTSTVKTPVTPPSDGFTLDVLSRAPKTGEQLSPWDAIDIDVSEESAAELPVLADEDDAPELTDQDDEIFVEDITESAPPEKRLETPSFEDDDFSDDEGFSVSFPSGDVSASSARANDTRPIKAKPAPEKTADTSLREKSAAPREAKEGVSFDVPLSTFSGVTAAREGAAEVKAFEDDNAFSITVVSSKPEARQSGKIHIEIDSDEDSVANISYGTVADEDDTFDEVFTHLDLGTLEDIVPDHDLIEILPRDDIWEEALPVPEKPAKIENVYIGNLMISKPLFDMFTEEAAGYWQTLSSSYALMQVNESYAPTEEMIRAAHTLAGIHGTTGFPVVFNVSKALEHVLLAAKERANLSAAPVSRMLPIIARAISGLRVLMDRILVKETFALTEEREAEEIVVELNALEAGDLSKATPPPITPTQDATFTRVIEDSRDEEKEPSVADVYARQKALQQSAAEKAAQKTGVDLDLVAIFLDEAQELLQSARDNFAALRDNRTDKDVALKLKRNLHTIKGSARMVGAMRLGEMAHQLETALEADSFDDAQFSDIGKQIDEIEFAVEQLRLGDFAEEETKETPEVLEASSVVTVADEAIPLDTPATEEVLSVEESVSSESDAASIKESVEQEKIEVIKTPLRSIAWSAPEEKEPSFDIALQLARERAKSEQQKRVVKAAVADEGTLLRVSSNRVDRLVNEAGEIIILRTRAEGELRDLKNDLAELTNNVLRLRQHLRVVEIEAESRIQAQLENMQDIHGGHFDPLEFDRFTLLQETTRSLAEGINDVSTIQQSILTHLDAVSLALLAQSRMSRDMQQTLFSVRTVPFSSVTERLQRIVRSLTQELQKQADLEIVGGQNEIDRAMLERLIAPLDHLLRNALDHGVDAGAERIAAGKPERAKITINVYHASGEIVIAFSDDGRGINREKLREKVRERGEDDKQYDDDALLNQVFGAGFSTAKTVTAISGRGIGLDIVRSEVLALGGRVEVESIEGEGTTFLLRLPLTVSVVQVMLVSGMKNRVWAISSPIVEQVDHVSEEKLAEMYKTGKATLRGETYPFYYFNWLLDYTDVEPETKRYNSVAFLASGHARVAIHVDQVIGNQEIVVKSAGTQFLRRINGFVGATIMGTGDIVLIVNPVHLAQRRNVLAPTAPEVPQSIKNIIDETSVAQDTEGKTILVVDDSLTVRKVTSRLLTREGFNVATAKDGFDALKVVGERRPDLILLDIEMPKMDGFEFAKLVKGDETLKAIPIIMITSRTADKHRRRAIELGVNGYLGKPYQEDELVEHIRELLAHPTKTMG